MTRKLFSVLLCAFALLLLMGAGTAPEQTVTILAEEESAILPEDTALITDKEMDEAMGQADPAVTDANPAEEAKEDEFVLLIDEEQAPEEVGANVQDGVTYVTLAELAKVLDESAEILWDAEVQSVTITTPTLTLTARVGQLYLEANGRYFYLPEGVQLKQDRVTVPLWAAAKAFDASVAWDAETKTVSVTRGSGAALSGDAFYEEESLFWLSRIIYAESGNQSLEGQMAVGNVVLNRVEDPIFPDTIEGVLAQKNQFSPYKGGKLANRNPNESSVIAAKLVLDGGVVEETEGALYFDSRASSWASRNKECVAVIGCHKFYR